jgi:serine/threonine-protein kinase
MADGADPTPTPLDASERPGRTEWLSQIRADQRHRWRRGEHVAAEAYLTEYPTLRDDEEGVLDLVYNEVVLREEKGEAPQVEEYLRRFPQYAAQLRRQFVLHRALGAGLGPGSTFDVPTVIGTTPPPRAEMAPGPWPAVPGYDILGILGRGGMGVVYRARQRALNRLVALKMLRDDAFAGPEARDRFRAEAAAVARLQHPNIVQVFEVGDYHGRPWFALELVDGGSLAHALQDAPLPALAAAGLIETLARAVAVAHERGIVHRDLKPDNILLVSGGVVSGEWSAGTAHHSPLTNPRSPTSAWPSASTTSRGRRAAGPSWAARRTWRRSRPRATCARSGRCRTCTRWGPSSTSA